MRPKISFSIADTPFPISLEDQFALARDLKVDGVEIVLGVKTFFGLKTLSRLVLKYGVNILSIHEPILTGFLFGERSFEIAAYFGAKYNSHPPNRKSLNSETSTRHFEKLFRMKEKYKIEILVENMPHYFKVPYLFSFSSDPSTRDLLKIKAICDKYGFYSTIDTSHIADKLPQNAKAFEGIFPLMRNIHLSSFQGRVEHLPLKEGELDLKGFLSYLRRKEYQNLITLEISPVYFISKRKYFKGIEDSINMVRSLIQLK